MDPHPTMADTAQHGCETERYRCRRWRTVGQPNALCPPPSRRSSVDVEVVSGSVLTNMSSTRYRTEGAIHRIDQRGRAVAVHPDRVDDQEADAVANQLGHVWASWLPRVAKKPCSLVPAPVVCGAGIIEVVPPGPNVGGQHRALSRGRSARAAVAPWLAAGCTSWHSRAVGPASCGDARSRTSTPLPVVSTLMAQRRAGGRHRCPPASSRTHENPGGLAF